MKKHTKNPLVSVIIPTKNSAFFLKKSLESIVNQSYKNIEIIVIDNNSRDDTKKIAKKYTKHVYNKGPERSAQTNFGVSKANGEFVYKVDSDFVLDKSVIEQCLKKIQEGFDAVIVHNTPDETVGWLSKIRKFEIDMYKYDLTHSAARFLKKSVYQNIGGNSENITAGEDYDFQNKLNRSGYKTGFIEAEALHLGEPKSLFDAMRKFYIYGQDMVNYKKENEQESKKQLSFIRPVYLKNWRKFLRQPTIAFSFILYNILKYLFGGTGFVVGKIKSKQKSINFTKNTSL
jgi:glycosyltransferase involved in cell wall biosynthesis